MISTKQEGLFIQTFENWDSFRPFLDKMNPYFFEKQPHISESLRERGNS
jgi:hypothetical protein